MTMMVILLNTQVESLIMMSYLSLLRWGGIQRKLWKLEFMLNVRSEYGLLNINYDSLYFKTSVKVKMEVAPVTLGCTTGHGRVKKENLIQWAATYEDPFGMNAEMDNVVEGLWAQIFPTLATAVVDGGEGQRSLL
ncbi:hypothetical protein BYT27DRAFT_7206559 [Phlegmacium glaucopus]|nr:hypothetical protein BYT27DRAFT_7206559 [Phlegmacium glaucopus]